ncbi:MAG: VIT family protein [Actinobacteria bacterium]|nr:VIT family protein [Actinomycetota bacterium]
MSLEEVYRRNLEHRAHRSGWLRAAVLGVNDGLVSNASLMLGFVAAQTSTATVITAGLAGIAAGALSMAVGEYVSVSSQTDIERADREIEEAHLALDPEGELLELAKIYEDRGIPRDLALQVAQALHDHNALEAHLRDELGQHDLTKARPIQAALASAAAFTLGGLIPLMGILIPALINQGVSIVAITILGLALAGVTQAKISGTNPVPPTIRIMVGGSLAMAVTAGIGALVHISGL